MESIFVTTRFYFPGVAAGKASSVRIISAPTSSIKRRSSASAVKLLGDLNKVVAVEARDDGFVSLGYSYPFASLQRHPEACLLAEVLLANGIGALVHQTYAPNSRNAGPSWERWLCSHGATPKRGITHSRLICVAFPALLGQVQRVHAKSSPRTKNGFEERLRWRSHDDRDNRSTVLTTS